ncbi:MAG: hypothetical protein V1744_02660 [Candidatus Altiarchaeota archaeon]
MRKTTVLSGITLLTLAGLVAATATTEMQSAATVICTVLANIQWLLFAIAAGIGVVVITLQGIKWAGSAEDPGARKQAKQGIIHAVIGLVIVLLAIWIVVLVFTGEKCSFY